MSRRKIQWFLPLTLAFVLALFCLPILAKASDAAADAGEGAASQSVLADPDGTEVSGLPEGAAPEEVEQGTAVLLSGEDEAALDPEPVETEDAAVAEEEPAEEASRSAAPAAESAEEMEEEEIEEPLADAPTAPTVMAEAHVQDIGWVEPKDASKFDIGTTGNGLRVEGFKIKLEGGTEMSGGIEYAAHVQDVGWQDFVRNGKLAGTTGRSLRVEALKIRLYGEYADNFDIYYCGHVQNIGWTDWAKNGEPCGSAGFSYRMEAVRIRIVPKGGAKPERIKGAISTAFYTGPILQLRAHVQDVGWMVWAGDGAVIGTTGRSLRLEAFQAKLNNNEVEGGIRYMGYVQGSGWQSWVSNGGTGGSVGKGNRVEAIKIELTGEAADLYDIYYRVHVGEIGWMAWTKNGEIAGPAGVGLRVESMQVQLVPKGDAAPSASGQAMARTDFAGSGVRYQAFVQGSGWQSEKKGGETAGTTGANKRVEGLKISIKSWEKSIPGGVTYRAYVQDTGWTSWVSDGAETAQSGTGKRVEAIEIKLTGELANIYDIYYRTHVQGYGWMGWAKNGEPAGTADQALRIEAVQINLVPKTNGAPGSTVNAFDNSSGEYARIANRFSSPTNWLILIDTDRHRIAIYRGSQGNWRQYTMWKISCGAPETPTVKGVFHVGSRGYSFGTDQYTCYWWTQFYGDYLMHSTLMRPGTQIDLDPRLGYSISHGCVRLHINDAKWIYDNIPSGTTVYIW
ncbi:MAG: L,D-transpeptidase family protein [Atopobiaceae bacterium]|nr:L,D-transpeptidase family protein [Atopobiaceae bacterium]